MSIKKEDSLKKRYFYKLSASIIGLPIILITQSIIPRGLGPKAYGDFNFLTNSFQHIIAFFDAGTSIGFYTKLSRRLEEKTLLKFYWYFVFVVCLSVLVLLPFVFILDKEKIIWPSQSIKFIWLSALYGLLLWGSQIINKVVDAYGITTKGEVIRVAQKFIGLILIVILFFSKELNLFHFFLYHYFIILLMCYGWWYVLKKNGISLFPRVKLPFQLIRKYIKEFWAYSHPLIVYAFVALLGGFFSLWMLQKFGGSVQQGYYSLGYKIAAVTFLFASAMTPLFTREFSIAFGKKDFNKMRFLHNRYIILIFFIVAFLSIFLSVNAEKVALIIGGNKFHEAKTAVMIMAIYPIHQTFGQLAGAELYATEKTKLYSNIGIIMIILDIPLAWFLLAPKNLFGLDLKSTGMTLNMVIPQFIAVNVFLWFTTKYLNISFMKFFGHQMFILIMLVILGIFAVWVSDLLISSYIFSFLAAGIIYSILAITIILIKPNIITFSRNELFNYIDEVKLKFIRK